MKLNYTPDGFIIISPKDDPRKVVDAMLKTRYPEEFCLSASLTPEFAASLMEAGFLVMTYWEEFDDGIYLIVTPKHHIERTVLMFEDLHIEKSAKRFLPRYELRVDTDFDTIVAKCVAAHGADWLTAPLVRVIKEIRRGSYGNVRPVSFGAYRDGELTAGEFGVAVGSVYTSYSGYHDENSAGKIQMILTARYLESSGFAFWDLGMPIDYKFRFGAKNVPIGKFVKMFRKAAKRKKRRSVKTLQTVQKGEEDAENQNIALATP
jgi:leucyl/phenylalanyl-tRNA--protein transferase